MGGNFGTFNEHFKNDDDDDDDEYDEFIVTYHLLNAKLNTNGCCQFSQKMDKYPIDCMLQRRDCFTRSHQNPPHLPWTVSNIKIALFFDEFFEQCSNRTL